MRAWSDQIVEALRNADDYYHDVEWIAGMTGIYPKFVPEELDKLERAGAIVSKVIHETKYPNGRKTRVPVKVYTVRSTA